MFFFHTPIKTISPVDACKTLSEAILIDVREKDEFARGHAHGAQNIPLSSLSPEVIQTLPKDKKLYIICQSGGRSARATAMIEKTHNPVFSVDGGTGEWQRSGLPME